MKQPIQRLAVGLAMTGGMMVSSLSHAQGVVNMSGIDVSSLNTSPNATYANWNGNATFLSQGTGMEVQSSGYGSLYFVVPGAQVQTLNPNDTQATLTFTVVGNAANYIWVGTPFILNDNSGAGNYGGYSGSGNPGNPVGTTWNGNTCTETSALSAGQIAAIQAGNDAIYSFNLEFDPSTLGGGMTSYDVIFNSLVLSPVPEPGTMALAGIGAAGLMIFRRRRQP